MHCEMRQSIKINRKEEQQKAWRTWILRVKKQSGALEREPRRWWIDQPHGGYLARAGRAGCILGQWGAKVLLNSEHIPCTNHALEKKSDGSKRWQGPALGSKLLSNLPVPPPDPQHKFLRKRESINHEPCKFAREGENRKEEFH